MQVNSINKKSFQLTDNGQLLGELNYESLFSLKAEIKLTNSKSYGVKSVGFFGTSIAVTENETEIANLKMNWRGQIVIAFQDGQEYIFKAKGLFSSKFTIENKDEAQLIQFDPKFDWSLFDYRYDIAYDKKPEDILLVVLGVYAANYYIATVSGATSGMM